MMFLLSQSNGNEDSDCASTWLLEVSLCGVVISSSEGCDSNFFWLSWTRFSCKDPFCLASVTRNMVDRRAISSVRREGEDSETEKKMKIENRRARTRMIGNKKLPRFGHSL